MFTHIFKTWSLAQLLHPLLFLVYLVFLDSAEAGLTFGGIFFIFFFFLFASIPSLLVAWLLLYVISNSGLAPGERFIAWFVSVLAAIIMNFGLLSVAIDGAIDVDMYEVLIPPMAAAVLSVLIRVRSFCHFQANYKLNS